MHNSGSVDRMESEDVDEEPCPSEASSTGEQKFKILGNKEELVRVMSLAGEVSRIASDRLLNEVPSEDYGDEHHRGGIELQTMASLTSASLSPLAQSIGDGTLREPKAARDLDAAAAFVVHSALVFCAPLLYSVPTSSWVPHDLSLIVVSPCCAMATAALFAACLSISEPREVRLAVAASAYPLSLCGLVSLCGVLLVEKFSGHNILLWTVIPLASSARAVSNAARLRGSEAFFDAMLEIVAGFFAAARGPIFRLVYCAMAIQAVHLACWSAARAQVRLRRCSRPPPGPDFPPAGPPSSFEYFCTEFILLASLYWTTQMIRSLVRLVVSGCAMHYLVRMSAQARPEDYALRPPPSPETKEDEGDAADDLLLGRNVGGGTKRLVHPPKTSRRSRGEMVVVDDKASKIRRRKEMMAAERTAESFFIRLSLTTSFGSVCRGALACPAAEFFRGLIDLLSASRFTRCVATRCLKPLLSRFVSTNRDLAFVHVALHNKSFATASRDISRIVEESGVAELLAADSVVPILHTFRSGFGTIFAALFSALTLIWRHGDANDDFDCQDKDSLLLHFAFGFIAFALAVEPVVATLETFYLAFAQAPHGLARVDPIVYRRFARILNRYENS